MEILMFAVCAIVALSCLSANLLIAYMIWAHWHDKKAEPAQPVPLEETLEEKEARRAAAEAQRRYEQGFINLMEFNGRAPKERE